MKKLMLQIGLFLVISQSIMLCSESEDFKVSEEDFIQSPKETVEQIVTNMQEKILKIKTKINSILNASDKVLTIFNKNNSQTQSITKRYQNAKETINAKIGEMSALLNKLKNEFPTNFEYADIEDEYINEFSTLELEIINETVEIKEILETVRKIIQKMTKIKTNKDNESDIVSSSTNKSWLDTFKEWIPFHATSTPAEPLTESLEFSNRPLIIKPETIEPVIPETIKPNIVSDDDLFPEADFISSSQTKQLHEESQKISTEQSNVVSSFDELIKNQATHHRLLPEPPSLYAKDKEKLKTTKQRRRILPASKKKDSDVSHLSSSKIDGYSVINDTETGGVYVNVFSSQPSENITTTNKSWWDTLTGATENAKEYASGYFYGSPLPNK